MNFLRSTSNTTYRTASSSTQSQFVGILQQKERSGVVISIKRIFANQELTIGRDRRKSQYVLNDHTVSAKHVRIYTILYESGQISEVAPLVYAEDLSRNGTYWNGSMIGKGNGGFLLSDGDTLRVSRGITFVYRRIVEDDPKEQFDMVQEYEMKRFEKEYIITDRLLGSGAYGRVYMAVEQAEPKRQLACKLVDLRKFDRRSRAKDSSREQPAAAEDVDHRLQLLKIKSWAQRHREGNQLEKKLGVYCREFEILAGLQHPNIISLEKVYVSKSSLYIFQELVTAGDLFSYIDRKDGHLSDTEAAVIVRQILMALRYIHDKNIVHRDLKPDNILMTSMANGSRVVLTDFGCARRVENQLVRMSTSVGTEEYCAPEIHRGAKSTRAGYTKAVDMWSLGVVTVTMLTGESPFTDPRTGEYSVELARQCNLEVLEGSTGWKRVGYRAKDFVNGLLILDERKRMNANEALGHFWFSNDVHNSDFVELYKRAIKHWQRRSPKVQMIEVIEGESTEQVKFLQDPKPAGKRSCRRSFTPIEPPYKPFPRRFHQNFFPPRRQTGPMDVMSAEVTSAIKDHWTFSKDLGSNSDGEHEELPFIEERSTTLSEKELNSRMSAANMLVTPEKVSETAIILHFDKATAKPIEAICKPFSPSAWQKVPNPDTAKIQEDGTTVPLKMRSRAQESFQAASIERFPDLTLAAQAESHTSIRDFARNDVTRPHSATRAHLEGLICAPDSPNKGLRPNETHEEPEDLQSRVSTVKLRRPISAVSKSPALPNNRKRQRRQSIFDLEADMDDEDCTGHVAKAARLFEDPECLPTTHTSAITYRVAEGS